MAGKLSYKELEEKKDYAEAGCNAQEATSSATLLQQIQAEKARVSKKLRDRIRELDAAERLLLNSNAEEILKDAQEVLWKEH